MHHPPANRVYAAAPADAGGRAPPAGGTAGNNGRGSTLQKRTGSVGPDFGQDISLNSDKSNPVAGTRAAGTVALVAAFAAAILIAVGPPARQCDYFLAGLLGVIGVGLRIEAAIRERRDA
jgi:hypothetical protein